VTNSTTARHFLVSLFFTGLPIAAAAQTPPVPGLVEGTVDGAAFSVPLDCSGWDNDMQRMVFSAGDDRRNEDVNGDGYAFVFSYLVPADRADGTLIAGDRTLAINSGFRPGPDAPKWEVDESLATFVGPTFGADVAQVEVTVDCAPRDASARGFTGRVTGSIAGTEIDAALFCGGWDGRDSISARTEEGAGPLIELFVIREAGTGTIEAEVGGETYQIVAAPIAGTEFDIGPDSVLFEEELTSSRSGNTYNVDLRFDCSER